MREENNNYLLMKFVTASSLNKSRFICLSLRYFYIVFLTVIKALY